MYFIEGLANGRIAVLGKIHHALADGVASANLMARGMDLQDGPEPDRDSYATDPGARPRASWCARRSPTTCARSAGCPPPMRYTAQGLGRVRKSSRKLSPGTDAAVHPAAVAS